MANGWTPDELGRAVQDLRASYRDIEQQVNAQYGAVLTEVRHVRESQARQGERLGSLEKSIERVETAFGDYVKDEVNNRRSLRNIVVAALVGVGVEAVLLVYMMASRT